MGFGQPGKFDYARRVAGALAYVALNNSDRVSLYLLGSQDGSPLPVLDSLGPRRGRGSIFEVFEFLAPRAGRADGPDGLGAVPARRKSRPGVAVVCSDMLLHGGYEEALRLLSYEKFQPMVVQVLSPQELQPDLWGDLHWSTARPARTWTSRPPSGCWRRTRRTWRVFVKNWPNSAENTRWNSSGPRRTSRSRTSCSNGCGKRTCWREARKSKGASRFMTIVLMDIAQVAHDRAKKVDNNQNVKLLFSIERR